LVATGVRLGVTRGSTEAAQDFDLSSLANCSRISEESELTRATCRSKLIKFMGQGKRWVTAFLVATGYFIGAVELIIGSITAFVGTHADVGPREQWQFALQGLAIASVGVLIIVIIFLAKRRTQQ
jgi:hypothetical protein